MRLLHNSLELQKFCQTLWSKPRINWYDLENSKFNYEFEQIKSDLGAQNARQIVYHVINDLAEVNRCACGKPTNWHYRDYLDYCSYVCSNIQTSSGRLQTNLKKYGVKNYAQSAEFKTKSKETFLQKYGVTNPSKSAAIQSKKVETSNLRYGAGNYSQSHLSSETISLISDKDSFQEFSKGKTVWQVADELGMSYSGPIKVAERLGIENIFVRSTRSQYEVKMRTLLDEVGLPYVINSKSIIPPLQLDFYIPSVNLAIEVGSMWFHCETSSNRGRKYHYNKWVKCRDLGITLLQYFDDDIIESWDIIQSKIRRLCGKRSINIGARKLSVTDQVQPDHERSFLELNHLQGSNFKRNRVYGAYYGNELMAIMTLMTRGNTAEIVRYCSDIRFGFPGLFTKMLTRFLRDEDFNGVITSFSDNRHSNGRLYKSAGFVLDNITPPGYSYTKNWLRRENRMQYQKHLLAGKFGLDQQYVDSKTEWEIMREQGYDRLWDAGQSKWIKHIV